jgi:pimeloyl-ACP methyl ester carboxylesterase
VARWRAACVRSLESRDRGHLSDILEPVVYSPAYVESHRDERAQRRAQIAALPEGWFRGLIGLLDSAHSLRPELDELAAVRCPTLIVAAELDGFIPLERARASPRPSPVRASSSSRAPATPWLSSSHSGWLSWFGISFVRTFER